MDPIREDELRVTRRQLFSRARTGIGVAALTALLPPELVWAAGEGGQAGVTPGVLPHFAPKAKRAIFLFQSGAPSQMDLFDYKPKLRELHGTELPDSVRQGQRLTGMSSGQDRFPLVNPIFGFDQYGQSGTWISELLPHTAKIVDDIAIIKSVHTDAINHDPAITFIQSGSQQPGRPSMGAWLSYGLGSANQDLPTFIALLSRGSAKFDQQPLFSRLWGSGFLPSNHQGVNFQSSGDPVLHLSDPPGISRTNRRRLIDAIRTINQERAATLGDPEIETRIAQYELAYRMQASVPDLMDLSDEPASTFDLYGEDARRPSTYAANCLLARRLAEKGVRFVQLYHRGWDQHLDLPRDLALQCQDTDQASAGLITDLKQRGLLDETLVIWGGEFGRTVYCQGTLKEDNYGRDHHPRCFTMWMAGGGIKPGVSLGRTDDFSYNILEDPVHVHDLQATILHCLGIDHKRLTYRYQGRDHRLTDVAGRVFEKVLL